MAEKKDVKIEMLDGKEISLKDLTEGDLVNVKMTLKDGKPNLTMKSMIVKSDEKFDYERRLFKWATMPALVMYDLPIPKSMAVFQTIKTEQEILDFALGNYAIETDKVYCGIEGTSKVSPEKLAEKMLVAYEKQGISKEKLANIKKAILAAGFGK